MRSKGTLVAVKFLKIIYPPTCWTSCINVFFDSFFEHASINRRPDPPTIVLIFDVNFKYIMFGIK